MGKSLHRFPSLGLKSRIDAGSSTSHSTRLALDAWGGLEQVRQWLLKRVLMRPEAAFPYVSAAEGAQSTRQTSRHAQRPAKQAATLNDPRCNTRPATLNEKARLNIAEGGQSLCYLSETGRTW